MPAGRPSEYNEALDKAYEYLERWNELGHKVPSHIGLALYINKSRTYLYEWAKQEDKKEFSDILEKITDLQFIELTSNGLSGDFNSNIVKLMLGKHGFHERKELTGEDGKPIQFEKVAIELVDTEPKDT